MSIVGLLEVKIYIPEAQSLKEKRSVIKSIKDKLFRHNISFSETETQDLHQKCHLSIVAVGNEQFYVERTFNNVINEIDRNNEGLTVSYDLDWLM